MHRLGSWQLLKRCYGYFLPYKLKVAAAFACTLVVSLSTAGTAWLVKPAMDDIFINKDHAALVLIPPAYVLLMLLKGAARFIQTYYMNASGMRVMEAIRNDLYAKIVRLPMRYFHESEVGMLMSRIVNDVGQISVSLPSSVMFVRQIFTSAALIGVVFYQDAYLAFWSVLVLPLAVYPFVYFGKRLRKLGRKTQAKVSDVTTLLQEGFSGIKVVKAFANEPKEAARFQVQNRLYTAIGLKQVLVSEMSSRVMELVGAFGVGLVLWYGGLQVIQGHSTPGTFFSFMAALIMLYEPIKGLNSANAQIQQALAGAERVFDILDSPDIRVEDDGGVEFTPPFRELEFRDAGFTYPRGLRPALEDVNLRIRAGERVALVGPSGSGKTTLANLIARFQDVQQGEVLLNGRPLRDYTLKSLRMNLGIVSQETFLFNLTVRENIAYAEGQFSDQDVVRAAEAAFAHEFIMDLPEGYETIIGERGVKLSGGQRQRLTIARALLKNPPLLILDEATSALDTEAERVVQMALENLMRDRTSVVIAHRLSTVLNADAIIVMENGRIAAKGAHRELLESCPLYARLYKMQFEDGDAA
ncbi:MAG: ABC transporter ATP-binding protein [Desulfovibrionaceae bacterium]|nr:ABC transporter ATP-binding protein [Desulfovibrionaceae bacterium]